MKIQPNQIWVEGKIKMKQLNMYLLTFSMFSLTVIAQGSNRLSEPDFKAANFAKAIHIEDRKLNGSVLRDWGCVWDLLSVWMYLWRAMFILQLPSHPWQGDRYMPTKWLGPLYQWREFYERGWSYLQRNTGDNTKLFNGVCPSEGNLWKIVVLMNLNVIRLVLSVFPSV